MGGAGWHKAGEYIFAHTDNAGGYGSEVRRLKPCGHASVLIVLVSCRHVVVVFAHPDPPARHITRFGAWRLCCTWPATGRRSGAAT